METGMGNGALRIQSIEPTVFFVQGAGGLEQGVNLGLANDGAAQPASVAVRVGGCEVNVDLGTLPAGESVRRIYIPISASRRRPTLRSGPEGRYRIRAPFSGRPNGTGKSIW